MRRLHSSTLYTLVGEIIARQKTLTRPRVKRKIHLQEAEYFLEIRAAVSVVAISFGTTMHTFNVIYFSNNNVIQYRKKIVKFR